MAWVGGSIGARLVIVFVVFRIWELPQSPMETVLSQGLGNNLPLASGLSRFSFPNASTPSGPWSSVSVTLKDVSTSMSRSNYPISLNNTKTMILRKIIYPGKQSVNRWSWFTRDWWVWNAFDGVRCGIGVGQWLG
jgi:hypothetical protein